MASVCKTTCLHVQGTFWNSEMSIFRVAKRSRGREASGPQISIGFQKHSQIKLTKLKLLPWKHSFQTNPSPILPIMPALDPSMKTREQSETDTPRLVGAAGLVAQDGAGKALAARRYPHHHREGTRAPINPWTKELFPLHSEQPFSYGFSFYLCCVYAKTVRINCHHYPFVAIEKPIS